MLTYIPLYLHKAMKNKFLSLAIFALIAGSGCALAQNVSIRWVFEEGTELIYRTTVSTTTEMPGGQGMMIQEIVTTQTWNVLDVAANGDATVRITTDRVQMDMDGPMGNMSIDSDSDQEQTNPQLRVATAQAGTSYTLVISSDGQIKDVQGIEEMLVRMREALSPDVAAMFDQTMGQFFTPESMKGVFQNSFGSFPAEPIDPTDTWEFTFSLSLPMLGGMTTTTTSTLDRIEDRGSRVAIISSTGVMQIAGEADGPLAGMLQIDKAVMTGNTEFDVDRGRLLKSSVSMTMEMTMTMGDQEMAMGSIAKTIVELVEG